MAVVFGAAVWPGGRPSPALARRADHAAALWRAGEVDLVVASGGLGRHPPAEAAVVRARLVAAAVPGDAVRLDDAAATTMETAAFVGAWRARVAPQCEIVGVTDRYHAPRAWLALWAHGVPARMSWPPTSGEPTWRPRLREAASLPIYAVRALARRLRRRQDGGTISARKT